MPFRDIIGHRQLTVLLARAAARGTLPPSLLFTGPEGVGKATTATALAQVINCERIVESGADATPGDAVDACGTCGSCRRIARAADAVRDGRERSAIDCLIWVAPDEKGSIKIDVVRQALGRAGYRPFDGRQRLVVIDHAESLEVEAQQALLKMLEEPPSSTRFALVTSQPDTLLATIRSRCPRLRFGPLSPGDIVDGLVTRFGWSEADANAAAVTSGGCLGVALRGLDAATTRARDVAAGVLEMVASSRGPLDRLEAAQVLAARDEGKGGREAGRSRTGAATRQVMTARLDAMSALLRDIGVLTTRADRRRLANVDLASTLDALAPAFAGDRLSRAFSAVDRARLAIDRNASQKIVADWVALNL